MAKPKFNNNGRILWEGISAYDGVPIVVIATGFKKKSANSKTGNDIQTWILRQDMKPNDAAKQGFGQSVCGDCIHQPTKNNTCYVRTYQAPRSVWECYKKGRYQYLGSDEISLFIDRVLRLGSYGDPAMVPVEVWSPLVDVATSHTGYTHQWRQEWAQGLKGICQASCDGLMDYVEASSHGWSTFLVKPSGEADPAGTVHCAASEERGRKTTCAACHLCDGSTAHVVIDGHGSRGHKVVLVN